MEAPLVALVLLAATSPNQARTLATFAAASPRPAACRPAAFESESRLWGTTRGGLGERACATLAFGYARLERSPNEALGLARAVAKAFADPIEPRVLEGRALVRLGDWVGAYRALEPAVKAKSRPLGDVAALRELGVAAQLTAHLAEAADAYRALVPRIGFMADPTLARIAVLEAASVLSASGSAGLADAEVYLGEARRQPPVPGLDDLTTAMLALTLDRSGSAEQARVLLRELDGAWSLERFLSARDRARLERALAGDKNDAAEVASVFSERSPMLVDGELDALIGFAATPSDARLARLHLQAYLDGPGARGPYAEWARARLAALPKSSAR